MHKWRLQWSVYFNIKNGHTYIVTCKKNSVFWVPHNNKLKLKIFWMLLDICLKMWMHISQNGREWLTGRYIVGCIKNFRIEHDGLFEVTRLTQFFAFFLLDDTWIPRSRLDWSMFNILGKYKKSRFGELKNILKEKNSLEHCTNWVNIILTTLYFLVWLFLWL